MSLSDLYDSESHRIHMSGGIVPRDAQLPPPSIVTPQFDEEGNQVWGEWRANVDPEKRAVDFEFRPERPITIEGVGVVAARADGTVEPVPELPPGDTIV